MMRNHGGDVGSLFGEDVGKPGEELPVDFDFAPELREKIEAIRAKYWMSLAWQMASDLTDAGVELHLAFHISVADLRVAAARTAMIACGIEKREPRRDLWMRRAAEDFDSAREWFGKLKDHKGDDAEICVACGEAIEDGELVYYEHGEGGHIHAACCGPERESYSGPDGEPLGPGDPIPEPFAFRAQPEKSER